MAPAALAVRQLLVVPGAPVAVRSAVLVADGRERRLTFRPQEPDWPQRARAAVRQLQPVVRRRRRVEVVVPVPAARRLGPPDLGTTATPWSA
jgi:hypothetical protein